MKQGRARRKKRIWILCLVFLLTLVLLLSMGKRGFIQQIRVRYERKQLQKEVVVLEAEKKELEKEKENLNDPEYIEKVAREKYGMAKKNEKVYRVVPKEKE